MVVDADVGKQGHEVDEADMARLEIPSSQSQIFESFGVKEANPVFAQVQNTFPQTLVAPAFQKSTNIHRSRFAEQASTPAPQT